jgi:hypothetical protein
MKKLYLSITILLLISLVYSLPNDADNSIFYAPLDSVKEYKVLCTTSQNLNYVLGYAKEKDLAFDFVYPNLVLLSAWNMESELSGLMPNEQRASIHNYSELQMIFFELHTAWCQCKNKEW